MPGEVPSTEEVAVAFHWLDYHDQTPPAVPMSSRQVDIVRHALPLYARRSSTVARLIATIDELRAEVARMKAAA